MCINEPPVRCGDTSIHRLCTAQARITTSPASNLQYLAHVHDRLFGASNLTRIVGAQLRVKIAQYGNIGIPTMNNFLVTTASAFGLFALANTVTSLLMLYVLKERPYYRQFKFEVVQRRRHQPPTLNELLDKNKNDNLPDDSLFSSLELSHRFKAQQRQLKQQQRQLTALMQLNPRASSSFLADLDDDFEVQKEEHGHGHGHTAQVNLGIHRTPSGNHWTMGLGPQPDLESEFEFSGPI